MFDIENWSKAKVHSVSLELLYSFNYMWFLMDAWMKEHCPDKAGSDEFMKLNGDFGAYEAHRLEKTVEKEMTGLDRIIQFLRHSHWSAFENLELTKLSDKRLRTRTIGCTTQKAAKKWGRDYYDCSRGATVLRQGFFSRIDPTAEVVRVFTPPDQKLPGTSDDVSCEWIITIK